MADLKPAAIPDETWIRVLVLQRLLEDVSASLGLRADHVRFAPNALRPSDDIARLLEERAAGILAVVRRGMAKAVEEFAINKEEAARIDAGFVIFEHLDTEQNDRFKAELWRARSLLSGQIFQLLRYLSVDRRSKITAETHGMGYHIHYLVRDERTDMLLLFDPSEPEREKPVLYWERHAQGSAVPVRPSPSEFGDRRRRDVYSACRRLLERHKKSNFRQLSKESAPLFPLPVERVA